ncbi:GspH/FimT family pseudopilin [Marinobacter mangrovi]|uniref:GspH/FimT family pseudopilin n=1 Tax=Marinobacter mangrovi TaxID=2803918 RepID=UPI0019330D1C|nr:GspH/FimT family pseudopilin [Marinobacter mangrovi]
MKPTNAQGFTLIELLITVTIASILLAVAAPSMNDLIEDGQRRSTIHDLLSFMAFARRNAIMTGSIVTVCPLNSNGACGSNWNNKLSLFVDPYNQRKLSDSTRLLRQLPAPDNGTLKARSLHSSYFQYRPNGLIYSDLGNITWCPADGNPRQAAHLIINRGGRIRLSNDTDGDGVPEKSDGNPVRC